jgi:hypothetical protein
MLNFAYDTVWILLNYLQFQEVMSGFLENSEPFLNINAKRYHIVT